MKTILCFGEILWDHFGNTSKPGGAPMNVAFHLHRQGNRSILISAVGHDNDGDTLLHDLREQGLSTDHTQVDAGLPTGSVTVTLDAQKQASYTIHQPVAWDAIRYPDQPLPTADALVFGSLACRSEISRNTLFRLLKQPGLKVFDMNLRPPHVDPAAIGHLLEAAHLLKINEHELAWIHDHYQLTGETEEAQLQDLQQRFGLQLICVTLGEKGALVLAEDRLYRHEGFPITVADTVGAGDSFLAAFITGYLQQQPIPQILERACATGAFVASQTGANPLYTQQMIDALITSRN